MKIYHYHPETGAYLSEGKADESPLEPGVFLIPAHATEAAPPAEVADMVRTYVGGAWVQRDVIAPPLPPEPTPEEIKEAKRIQIELQRDMTLGAGLTWNGNKYHIDPTMIAALNGRLTLWQEGKIAPGEKLPIRRMDNVIELLDRKQHADLADALRLHGEAVYAASWVEKDKL